MRGIFQNCRPSSKVAPSTHNQTLPQEKREKIGAKFLQTTLGQLYKQTPLRLTSVLAHHKLNVSYQQPTLVNL